MYSNGPVGQRPVPRFLSAQTRPMGGAPTILMPPPPPTPPGTLIDGSPAGASITANLYSLGVMCWTFLRELFNKVHAAVRNAL